MVKKGQNCVHVVIECPPMPKCTDESLSKRPSFTHQLMQNITGSLTGIYQKIRCFVQNPGFESPPGKENYFLNGDLTPGF